MLRGETTVWRDMLTRILTIGKQLVTGLDDGSAYVWDVQDGRRIRQVTLAALPQGPISYLSWTGEDVDASQPDSKTVQPWRERFLCV